jgi:hypothetical protein
MSQKKVVHYVGKPVVQENGHALVCPVDHPDSESVSNMNVARTSRVVHYDEKSGRLETQNTIYIPAEEIQLGSGDVPWY